MAKMKLWLASIVALSLVATSAIAQGVGQLQPGQAWANSTTGPGVAAPTNTILGTPFVNGVGAIINPVPPSNSAGVAISQTTPNTGSLVGPVLLNSITAIDQAQTVTGSALDSFGQIGNQTDALRINHRVTGGVANHFGLSVASNITGTNGGVSAIVGGTYTNVGGPITGDQWGLIGYANIGPSGNLNQSAIAAEFETLVATGGVVRDRVALSLNSQGPVAATGVDAAIVVNLATFNAAPYNGAAPFHDGIYFSNNFYGAGAQPIATNGNILRSDAATINSFANFANVNTNFILQFPNMVMPGNSIAGFTLPTQSAGGAMQFGGQSASGINIEIDAFTGPSRFVGRRADTSSTAPSAVQSGEAIGGLTAQGYTGSVYNEVGSIGIYAAQTFTGANNGSYISLQTTPLNSTVEAEVVRIQQGVTVTSTQLQAFAVGANGLTNPVFQVAANQASVATGLQVIGLAAGNGVSLVTTSSGTNEPIALNGKAAGAVNIGNNSTGGVSLALGGGGVTIGSALTYGGVTFNNAVTGSGNLVGSVSPTFTGTVTTAALNAGQTTVTSNSSLALAVGPAGQTNPVLQIDGSIASQAAGVRIVGNASGSGAGVSVISSAANEPLALNGKGSGGVNIGNISTGAITLSSPVTLGATVSGGGNQINNVIIGASTPLAGTFTTLTANTSVTSPVHAASGALTLQSNGSTLAGTITTGQNWGIGKDTNPQALLVVGNNTATGIPVPNNTVLAVNGVDGSPAVLAFQSWATGQNPTMLMRGARGTSASPSASQVNDVLGFFSALGYGASQYDGVGGSGFYVGAGETHTNTAAGTFLSFLTTANTTLTRSEAMRVNGSGGLSMSPSGTAIADPGTGNIAATKYFSGTTAGVTCSGSPTASFASTNGIVTHC